MCVPGNLIVCQSMMRRVGMHIKTGSLLLRVLTLQTNKRYLEITSRDSGKRQLDFKKLIPK